MVKQYDRNAILLAGLSIREGSPVHVNRFGKRISISDLIIAESEADELSAPVTRNIVRMDLAPGTSAYAPRVIVKPQSRLVQPAPAGVHYGRNLLAEAHGR